jgi:hypothetical protein
MAQKTIIYRSSKHLALSSKENAESSQKMAHNVPAVYDVLAARIRDLRSKDQGRQNVAEVLRGNGAQRNDLAKP